MVTLIIAAAYLSSIRQCLAAENDRIFTGPPDVEAANWLQDARRFRKNFAIFLEESRFFLFLILDIRYFV